jgi:hypothetical protein
MGNNNDNGNNRLLALKTKLMLGICIVFVTVDFAWLFTAFK